MPPMPRPPPIRTATERGFEVQSTTNMSNSNSWAPLDVIGNEPFFSITNLPAVVSDALSNSTSRFYRVRVFEP